MCGTRRAAWSKTMKYTFPTTPVWPKPCVRLAHFPSIFLKTVWKTLCSFSRMCTKVYVFIVQKKHNRLQTVSWLFCRAKFPPVNVSILSVGSSWAEDEKAREESSSHQQPCHLFCFHPLRPLSREREKKSAFPSSFYLSLHICEFACLLLALFWWCMYFVDKSSAVQLREISWVNSGKCQW